MKRLCLMRMLEGLMRQTLLVACITYTYLLSSCYCVCVSGFCAKLSQQVAAARGVYVMRGGVNNILESTAEDIAERGGRKAAMQWAKCRSIACQKQKAKLSHAILCRRLSSLIRFQCAKNSAENLLQFGVVVAVLLLLLLLLWLTLTPTGQISKVTNLRPNSSCQILHANKVVYVVHRPSSVFFLLCVCTLSGWSRVGGRLAVPLPSLSTRRHLSLSSVGQFIKIAHN